MAETLITTDECAWKDVSVQMLGRKFTGLRGFSLKESTEKEHIFASSGDPIDIVEGNTKPEGSLKMLKYEFDALNDAAKLAGFRNIAKVPHALIVINVQFKKTLASSIRSYAAIGVAFMDWEISMEQGGKFTEVTLPFICMKIEDVKK
jgi:hypothetical protein